MNDSSITKGHGADCEGFLDLLPLYEGGELDLDRAIPVRDHLATCAECREQWTAGQEAIALRQAAWALDAGGTPDLWPGIQNQLRSEGILTEAPVEVSTTAGQGTLLRFPGLRYAAAAALLVGMAAAGWHFMGADRAPMDTPNGSGLVAEVGIPAVSELAPVVTSEVAEVVPTQGLLRRMGPDESSVLDEARPWGLEEAPAVELRQRTESMQVAGWK